MKAIRAVLSCVCIISVSTLTTASGHSLAPVLLTDEPFDSYGDVSWEDEKAHLDNFAIALQHDLNLIGYIIAYAGRRACLCEAQDRALRAKEYLVKTHSIRRDRIRWIDGGHREVLTVILQPVPRGAPELTVSPTVKPSDVQIIKNCKPKIIKNNIPRSPRPHRKQRRLCQ